MITNILKYCLRLCVIGCVLHVYVCLHDGDYLAIDVFTELQKQKLQNCNLLPGLVQSATLL